ncbi:TspO/MBR family protein [Bosea sp. LC85]|nr:TspO/MBR family protein [Bosea sp. LC85]
MRNGNVHLAQARGVAQGARLADTADAPHAEGISTLSSKARNSPRPIWGDLSIAVVPVVAASLLGSAATVPQIPGWHAALAKPWSFAFFGMQSPLAGILVILPLLAMILVTITRFRPLDRHAANLLRPYAAWVSFATLLTISIWLLNRSIFARFSQRRRRRAA